MKLNLALHSFWFVLPMQSVCVATCLLGLLSIVSAYTMYGCSVNPTNANGQTFILPKTTSNWTSYPRSGISLPERYLHTGVVDWPSKKYYVYGGGQGTIGVGVNFNDLWVFDLVTGIWSQVPSSGINLSPARQGSVSGLSAVINGRIYFFGGQDSNTMYGDMWSFNIAMYRYDRMTFSAGDARPLERWHGALTVRSTGDKMYVFCGQAQSGYLNDMWEFTPYSPSFANGNMGGAWLQVASVSNRQDGVVVKPPPVIRVLAAYDSDRDVIWAWGGQYEQFSSLSPSNVLYMWQWAAGNSAPSSSSRAAAAGNQDVMTFLHQQIINFAGSPQYVSCSSATVGSGCWTNFSMSSFATKPEACSWYYGNTLYMYGGVDYPIEVIQNGLYSLNLSASLPFTWRQLNYPLGNFQTLLGRRGHDCEVIRSFPFMNINNTGVIMSGGFTNTGMVNEVLFLDLVNKTWYQVLPQVALPRPRTAHVAVANGLQIIMFGGKDAQGNLLDDMWSARVIVDSSLSDITDIVWSPITFTTSAKPDARCLSEAVALNGVFYLFGGMGVQQRILNDFWSFSSAYNADTKSWSGMWTLFPTQTIAPVGRYGHTFTVCGSVSAYLFGGVSNVGQLSDLWRFDQLTLTWTQLQPAFPNAMWPFPRSFHTASFTLFFHHAETVVLSQNYVRTAKAWARSYLYQFNTSMFPPTALPGGNARDEYWSAVSAHIDKTSAALSNVAVGDTIPMLVVYGGDAFVLGGVVADMWIFDINTGLWQVPGNFSAQADAQFVGRARHTSVMFGNTFVTQGGQDDWVYRSASPALLNLVIDSPTGYSYPYTKFPRDTSKVLGSGTDAIAGGLPPTPLALPPSFLVSMPPYIIGTPCAYIYPDGSNFAAFTDSATGQLKLPANTAWTTVGMNSEAQAIALLDSIIFIGGNGLMPGSTTPNPVSSAVSSPIWRVKLTPICPTTSTTYAPGFGPPGQPALRQSSGSVPGDTCYKCGPGTRLLLTANYTKCVFCPAGSYTAVTGAVQCLQCPPGFYSTQAGGGSLQSCLACGIGYWNPSSGQSSCLVCPRGMFCGTASKQYLTAAPVYQLSSLSESQPQPMSNNAAHVYELDSYAGYACISFMITAFVLYLITRNIRYFRRRVNWEQLDLLFAQMHRPFTKGRVSRTLQHQWMEFYIVEWQLPIGGLCCLMYICIAIIASTIICLPIFLNNITENANLIPTLVIDASVKAAIRADLTITANFVGYGDVCESLTVPGQCAAGVSVATTFMSPDNAANAVTTCKMVSGNCTMTWSAPKCNFQQDRASITFTSIQDLAFATSITWRIVSTTGVQTIIKSASTYVAGGQLSTMSNVISPSTTGNVFRGSTPASVNIINSYSLYSSTIGTDGAGYLVQFSSQSAGTSVDATKFSLVTGLSLQMVFNRANTAFNTQQVATLDAFSTVSSLAGALSSLLGVVGFLMGMLEDHMYDANSEEEVNQSSSHPDEVEETEDEKKSRLERAKKATVSLVSADAPAAESSGGVPVARLQSIAIARQSTLAYAAPLATPRGGDRQSTMSFAAPPATPRGQSTMSFAAPLTTPRAGDRPPPPPARSKSIAGHAQPEASTPMPMAPQSARSVTGVGSRSMLGSRALSSVGSQAPTAVSSASRPGFFGQRSNIVSNRASSLNRR